MCFIWGTFICAISLANHQESNVNEGFPHADFCNNKLSFFKSPRLLSPLCSIFAIIYIRMTEAFYSCTIFNKVLEGKYIRSFVITLYFNIMENSTSLKHVDPDWYKTVEGEKTVFQLYYPNNTKVRKHFGN